MVFPLAFARRKKVNDAMKLYNAEGIIFKMLVTQHNVIAIEQDKDFMLSTKEINAIFHLINAKFQYVSVDYFLQICIPSISGEGYLYLYFRW